MTMLVPVRRSHRPSRALVHDPFESFFNFRPFAMENEMHSMMKTDIKQTDEGLEVLVDLPGFQKENVQAELKDGYLSISAKTSSENEEKDEEGNFVRRERFSGSCSRSFYVGEDITEEEVKAKFEDGVLRIAIPKQQPEPEEELTHTIEIEG